MTSRFLIDDNRVSQLAATRQGRVSISGFTYQAAYAVGRLASMHARQPLPGFEDIPAALRYDWAEDLDELEIGGLVRLTQCKRVADIGQPSKFANVLLGFAPKWLWSPTDQRSALRFRLVSTDPRFRADRPLLLAENEPKFEGGRVRAQMVNTLATPAAARSDRELWQYDADAVGHQALADALWAQVEAVYLADSVLLIDPTGMPLLPAERAALDLLVRWRELDAGRQGEALTALRAVVHANVVAFDPISETPTGLAPRTPRVIDRADVAAVLLELQSARTDRVLRVIGRRFLEEQALLVRREFVARPPEWSDVVHGADPRIRFVERDLTSDLVRLVREHVVAPLARGDHARLPAVFVLGAPGSGKSTLMRRTAAILVQEGVVTAADPGLNLPRINREDFNPILDDLARLATDARPVLLLLDDPFFADSGWDSLVERIARWQKPVGVLGASPDFLFEKFGVRIQKGQIASKGFTLPSPSPRERSALAHLYGRDSLHVSDREDDLLVLAMEAATGEPFDVIITRIWTTLNDGQPIDPFALPTDLPWPVRAYLVVCYFHRAYRRCPETLLREALSAGTDTPEDYGYRLNSLALREGWRIFSVEDPASRMWTYQGRTIASSHQRIARAAWRLRPVPAFDVADWVIPASLRAEAPVDVAVLAATLKDSVEPADRDLARRLASEWNAHEDEIRVVNLAGLAAFLDIYGAPGEARLLEPALRRRAALANRDSWVAARQLWHLSAEDSTSRQFPSEINLEKIIDAADFAIAPRRAVQFAMAVGRGSPEYRAIVRRLIAALEDRLNWKLDDSLLSWLLANLNVAELNASRITLVHDWLTKNTSGVSSARAKLLSLFATAGTTSLALAELKDVAEMLAKAKGDARLRVFADACIAPYRRVVRNIDNLPDPKAARDTLNSVRNALIDWFDSLGLAAPVLALPTETRV